MWAGSGSPLLALQLEAILTGLVEHCYTLGAVASPPCKILNKDESGELSFILAKALKKSFFVLFFGSLPNFWKPKS